jgi:hypothetical protein
MILLVGCYLADVDDIPVVVADMMECQRILFIYFRVGNQVVDADHDGNQPGSQLLSQLKAIRQIVGGEDWTDYQKSQPAMWCRVGTSGAVVAESDGIVDSLAIVAGE